MPTLVTDDFNRTDGALGANWTGVTGLSGCVIVSNQVRGNAAAHDAAIYTATALATDQWASHVPAVPNSCGVVVRGISSVYTHYYSQAANFTTVTIGKSLAGAQTIVTSSGAIPTFTATDVCELDVKGSSLEFKVNGVVVLAGTDSAIDGSAVGGPYSGIHFQGTTARLDDFVSGEFDPIYENRPQAFAMSQRMG